MDPLDQPVYGFTLANNAEIMSMMSRLKTQHGEHSYHEPFLQFLRSRGWTEAGWMQSYNHWHAQMQADPNLAAKFHTFMANYHTQQLTAGQQDVSGFALEGLSLEMYAKISAQSQTGASVEGLVAGAGLSMDQWQRAQSAWGQKLSTLSPTDPLILQYGQLYQKWAPNHQASMEASTEQHLREASEREGRADGMNMALTLDNAPQFFSHANLRVKVRGVNEMVRMWELQEDMRGHMRPLTQQAFDIALQVAIHGAGNDKPGYASLTQHVDAMDIHAWSTMHNQEDEQHGTTDMACGALKDLASAEFMSPAQNDAAQEAVRQALSRAQGRGHRVYEAAQGVRDEMKSMALQSLVGDYQQLVEDLKEALEEWDYEEPSEESMGGPMRGSMGSSAHSVGGAQSSQGGELIEAPAEESSPLQNILDLLSSFPVIGPYIRKMKRAKRLMNRVGIKAPSLDQLSSRVSSAMQSAQPAQPVPPAQSVVASPASSPVTPPPMQASGDGRPASVPAGAVWDASTNEWKLAPVDASGQMHGDVHWWRVDGTLCCVTQFYQGTPHGSFRRLHPTGEVAREGTFVQGHLHGTEKYVRSDAPSPEEFPAGLGPQVWYAELDYNQGQPVGGRTFDRSGNRLQ